MKPPIVINGLHSLAAFITNDVQNLAVFQTEDHKNITIWLDDRCLLVSPFINSDDELNLRIEEINTKTELE